MRERNVRNLSLILLVAALGLASAPARASDAALVAAAEQEGSLTLYGCDPPQTPLYVARFKQLYPKIQVSTYVAGCWQIYNRHVTERGARRQAADVFFATEDVMTKMSGEHLFSPEWSEHVDARRVRHLWECEACGYAFETTIRIAAA